MEEIETKKMSESLWPADYGVSADHCGDVLRGSYEVPFTPEKALRILDIGANVGAFCIWAAKRWPGCTIDAYEPHPGTFKLLRRTIVEKNVHGVTLHEQGVHEKAERVKIFSGPNNIGEASVVIQHEGVKSFMVDLIAANELPFADILKMDTEGCEAPIIRALSDSGRLEKFSAVMMETHGPADQDYIMGRMAAAGFTITKKNQWHANRCELCWVRADLLPKDFKAQVAKRVLIATPLLGSVSAHYLGAMLTLMKADWEGRYDFSVQIKTGGSVATARNMAADDALKGGYDKILWWDKDLTTEDMNTFLSMANRLLGHDVEFVGSTYVAHTKHTHFHGKMKEGAVVDSRGLLPMEQMPLGFTVMDVSVLRRIKAMFPLRTYTAVESGGNTVKDLYEFFHEGIIGPNTPEGKIERITKVCPPGEAISDPASILTVISGILGDMDTSKNSRYGEDYFFCDLCAKAGVELYRDTYFIIPHEQMVRMPIPSADLRRMLDEDWRNPAASNRVRKDGQPYP